MAPRRVLVVDDEEAIRLAMRLALEDEAFEVAEAANGQDALDTLRRAGEPLVVVLDLMMPVLSGVRLIHMAGSAPRLARHRYVVVTAAHAFPADELAAFLPPGHLTVVAKPFDIGHLAAAVEHAAWQLVDESDAS